MERKTFFSLTADKNISPPGAIINPSWFTDWFDSIFYQKLYSHRNEEEAAKFIDQLIIELQPLARSKMLDLACGAGRHSYYLASKGFDVTGIDLASSCIRSAKKKECESLRFYQRDMRHPFGNNQFDYIFNFFTSFGYFNDPQTDNTVVQNISRALRSSGLLVLDYFNAAYSEKRLVREEIKEIDGAIYRITRWVSESDFFKRIVVANPIGEILAEHVEQIRKISVNEFDHLLNIHGMRIQEVYGDYQLNEYDHQDSPRLILIAKKIK